MQSAERAKSPNGSVTFRFDNEILNELRNEADQKRISLNTLASQIFQSYIEYDMYASRAWHDLVSQVLTGQDHG